MKKWTKLTLPLLFRRSIVKIDITIWGEVPRQLLQNFSLDNFGADSGDLDRSLYNPSMITRLLQAVTHFAGTTGAELFTKHARRLITYLIHIRGILDEVISPWRIPRPWWTSGFRERHASEWRIIKSQHRCALPPLQRPSRGGGGRERWKGRARTNTAK